MIHRRQKFDFHHQTLIEKVTIRPPFRYEAIFQDEGCFLYVDFFSNYHLQHFANFAA